MEALNIFEKATSKEGINEIFQHTFKNRHRRFSLDEMIPYQSFFQDVSDEAILAATEAIKELIGESLYTPIQPVEILELIPESINDKIRKFLGRIVVECRDEWRKEAIERQLSLPRLDQVDWRIDLKTASDQRGRMSIPSLIVNMSVETAPKNLKEDFGTRNINFELGKEGLEILLEGLREIKTQLDSIQG